MPVIISIITTVLSSSSFKSTPAPHSAKKEPTVASPFIDKEPDWPTIDSDDDREIYNRAKYEISDPIRKDPKIMPYTAGSGSMGPGLLKTFPYHGAICGGRGCIRACMIHLEKTQRIKNLFHNDFRKRPLW